MTKKWYQSKKFWAALLPLLVGIIDLFFFQATGQHLDIMAWIAIGSTSLGYIFMEGGLDARAMRLKQNLQDYNPLQDPVIRDLITSLIQHNFNFQAAAENLGLHSSDVIQRVMTDLSDMLSPELADNAAIRTEVARLVAKQYDQDQKMLEGAKLASGEA